MYSLTSENGYEFSIAGSFSGHKLKDVNPAEELKKLLKKAGRTRKWLAEQTGYKESSVKQYLGGSKGSQPFYEKAKEVLLAELASHSPDAKPPLQWDLLFETEEQFRKVDRASRMVDSVGILEFCRATLLARAEEILKSEERSRYPIAEIRAMNVADSVKSPPGK